MRPRRLPAGEKAGRSGTSCSRAGSWRRRRCRSAAEHLRPSQEATVRLHCGSPLLTPCALLHLPACRGCLFRLYCLSRLYCLWEQASPRMSPR